MGCRIYPRNGSSHERAGTRLGWSESVPLLLIATKGTATLSLLDLTVNMRAVVRVCTPVWTHVGTPHPKAGSCPMSTGCSMGRWPTGGAPTQLQCLP